jgi:hypothetical protein
MTKAMAPADLFCNVETAAEEISRRTWLLESFTTESVRRLRREFSKRLAKSAPRFVVDVALRVFDHSTAEHRFVAYELVSSHPAALASLGEKDLILFGRGLGSWGSVDMFACYLAGPAWRERIEDMFAVGQDGKLVMLSHDLPRTADEVEKAMAK